MPTLLRPATDLLTSYARHHRDRRNILTHAFGIPLVVFSAGILLGRPLAGLGLSLAWLIWGACTLWYLTRGQFALGLATAALTAGLLALAAPVAAAASWLAWGLGSLAVGWALQYLGHCYEGRRSVYVDDLRALLVGPLFIAAEALFALGWCAALRREIERRVGPTHLRDLTLPAV